MGGCRQLFESGRRPSAPGRALAAPRRDGAKRSSCRCSPTLERVYASKTTIQRLSIHYSGKPRTAISHGQDPFVTSRVRFVAYRMLRRGDAGRVRVSSKGEPRRELRGSSTRSSRRRRTRICREVKTGQGDLMVPAGSQTEDQRQGRKQFVEREGNHERISMDWGSRARVDVLEARRSFLRRHPTTGTPPGRT